MAHPRSTTKQNGEKKPTRKVVSARGETVDFDLLKIKAQINESSPKTIEVVARERFIDKRRRRTNRKIDEMLSQQADSKRYAEDAIKSQQEVKAAANQAAEDAANGTTVIEIVAAEEPVVEAQPDVKADPKKFNRKLNK